MKAGDLYTVAGALPVLERSGRPTTAPAGSCTQMGTPVGVAVTLRGALYYADASADTVRVPSPRGGHVSRFGRRTFLASSAGVAAGAVAGDRRRVGVPGHAGGAADRSRPVPPPPIGGPLRAGGLTVNGVTDPVGIDPDDCSFAWTLPALGRGGAQTAFRMVVRRTDPAAPASPGTAAPWIPPGRPSSPTAGRRWPPMPPTAGPSSPGASGQWGPSSAPARFTTRCAPRTGRRAGGSARPGLAATRPRHVPPHRGDPARRQRGSGHGLRVRRPHVPVVRRRRGGGRLAELLLSRRAVRAGGGPDRRGGRGRPAPSACCTAGTGRAGPPRLLPGTARAALGPLHRRPSGALRVRRHLARAARPSGCRRRSATPTSATSWSGSTGALQPEGWSSPGFDDARGRPSPSSGRRAPRRSAAPSRSAPPSARCRCVLCGCTPWRRRGRGGLRCGLRGTTTGGLRPGRAGTHGHDARRLPPRSRRPGLHAARDAGDQPLFVVHHARGPPGLRGFHLLRLPLPADRRPRPALGPDDVVALARHAAMPDVPTRRSPRTTACSTPCGA